MSKLTAFHLLNPQPNIELRYRLTILVLHSFKNRKHLDHGTINRTDFVFILLVIMFVIIISYNNMFTLEISLSHAPCTTSERIK